MCTLLTHFLVQNNQIPFYSPPSFIRFLSFFPRTISSVRMKSLFRLVKNPLLTTETVIRDEHFGMGSQHNEARMELYKTIK